MKAALGIICLAACGSHATPATPIGTAPVHPVPPPLELHVSLLRWTCAIAYPGGQVSRELHVPVNRQVHFVFENRDVPLDVAIPSLDVHVHVEHAASVPLDVTFPRAGALTWQCPTQTPPPSSADPVPAADRPLVVEADYATWEATLAAAYAADHPTTREGKIAFGARVAAAKACTACHTADGTPRIGPSWKGLWGTTVALADGSSVVVDANYIRESMMMPQKRMRPGYPPTMPSFDGQLREVEIESLVAYIESLSP